MDLTTTTRGRRLSKKPVVRRAPRDLLRDLLAVGLEPSAVPTAAALIAMLDEQARERREEIERHRRESERQAQELERREAERERRAEERAELRRRERHDPARLLGRTTGTTAFEPHAARYGGRVELEADLDPQRLRAA